MATMVLAGSAVYGTLAAGDQKSHLLVGAMDVLEGQYNALIVLQASTMVRKTMMSTSSSIITVFDTICGMRLEINV